MKLVQRGNKQLRVEDGLLPGMLSMGYAEVDPKTGIPLAPPIVVKSDAALKKENAALRKENQELKARLEALTRDEL